MFKLSSIFYSRRRRRAAEESNYGRRCGWFIEKDGVSIGELEYLRWLPDGQFWHKYRVTWYKPEDAVISPDEWIEEKLKLRNRRYSQVVIDSFMTSGIHEGEIAIRNAYVSEELMDSERSS